MLSVFGFKNEVDKNNIGMNSFYGDVSGL